MKRLFWFCCLLMIFGSWAEAAPAPQCAGGTRIVSKGETPSQIFGKNWKSELSKYGISDPKRMPIGLRICAATNVNKQPTSVEQREFLWKKPGAAPVKGCGRLSEEQSNEAAWQAHGIPETDRQELRQRMASQDFDNRMLKPGERFSEMSGCKKGKVRVVKNVVAAWPDSKPVPARIFTLSSGKRWAWVRNCGNWLPLADQIIPQAPPLVEVPVVVVSPEQRIAQAACDEWNVHAGAGIERSIANGYNTTALYGDVEVGACPFTWKSNNGQTYNEALLAARGHWADDNYHDWDGKQKLLLAGFGIRQSHKDGSGDLYRLMFGSRSNVGSESLYHQDVRWNAFGLYGTHYRIGRNGENETHYRWGVVLPIGKARGTADWDGSSLDLPEWKWSAEAGVRRFLTKRGEDVRWFWELNASVIKPDYAGFSPRVGACLFEDTVCPLVGVNIGVYPETGFAAAIGVQVNTPGVIRVNRDGIRSTQVAQAAEVNGVQFEFSRGEDSAETSGTEMSAEEAAANEQASEFTPEETQ